MIGLPQLETFTQSYGLGGTILGLPSVPVHLEIVRFTGSVGPREPGPLDELVLYLFDKPAQRPAGLLAVFLARGALLRR